MKKLLLVALLALPIVVSAAGETNAPVDYYKAGVSLESFYQVVTDDFDGETGSVGLGLSVFLNKNFGVGISTDVPSLNGQLVDNISVRGIYRVPIEKTALYGYGGSTRLLKEEDWTINLGIGVEHRFTKNVGPFVEAGMLKEINGGAKAVGRVGFRVSF